MSMMRRRLLDDTVRRTAEGEAMAVRSVARMRPGLSIYGKSHQNTVAGNQLLNPELFNADEVIYGITFTNNHDGSVSVSGTATSNPSWYLGNYINVWEDGETYRISLDSSNVGFSFVIVFSDGRREYSQIVTVDKSTMTSIMPYLQVVIGSTVNETVYPMVNKGSTALPWEPYTGGQPSPNPDYPQEIVSVGDDGEIGVNVYGGNLIESIYGAKNGETVTGGKGNINVDDYSDSTFVELPGYGHERVMQWISSHTSGYSLYIQLFDKNKNHLELSDIKYFSATGQQNVHYVINVPAEAMYYCITGEGNQCIVDEIILNIGSTALPFEPYKQPQSLIVSTPDGLPGIPVSSGGNYTDENGQQWISDEVDYNRGKYVQRVNIINSKLSDLDIFTGGGGFFGINGIDDMIRFSPLICNILKVGDTANVNHTINSNRGGGYNPFFRINEGGRHSRYIKQYLWR